MDDEALVLMHVAKLEAYREAFRQAFVAYLVVGHGNTEAEAMAEAERVMAETDRRIEDDHGWDDGTSRDPCEPDWMDRLGTRRTSLILLAAITIGGGGLAALFGFDLGWALGRF